jgi:hypothetical protein
MMEWFSGGWFESVHRIIFVFVFTFLPVSNFNLDLSLNSNFLLMFKILMFGLFCFIIKN